jgi:hypothetical protein
MKRAKRFFGVLLMSLLVCVCFLFGGCSKDAEMEGTYTFDKMVMEIEGEEGLNHIDEYLDSNTERGKKMRKAICDKFKFASIEFQSLDGLVKAIGLEKCKLCTYCWDGKE